jgi:NADPH-dependent curcumin reductase CurA
VSIKSLTTRRPAMTDALLRAAPSGIDVYFDNVGGAHLEAALAAANQFARFALCGMISIYNATGLPDGPRNIMFVVGKSIRLEGFTVSNYFNLIPEFERDMTGWMHEGKVAWKETVVRGIENAPTAFLKLFKGESFGRRSLSWGDARRPGRLREGSMRPRATTRQHGLGYRNTFRLCA